MRAIYDLLRQDHQTVRDLLEKLVTMKSDSPHRENLLSRIRDELIPHARAEEAVLYNSLRSVPVIDDEAWHGYKEHMQAETLLRSLQVAETMDAGFETLAKKLKDTLEHHIQEEEGHLFQLAQTLITEEEAEQMGRAFQSLKEKVKEKSFFGTTVDMIANMMPLRFGNSFREGNTTLYSEDRDGGGRQEKIA